MLITIFIILALIFSAVFHEYAHGWMANKLGDPTAKNLGRLTLNPLPHLDPLGSVVFPLFLVFFGSNFILAWAKPVPYNPYNLRDQKYGDLKVALAGPGTNFLLALFFGLVARFISVPLVLKQSIITGYFQGNSDFILSQMNGSIMVSIFVMSIIICFINLLLMVFNLIPVPPLDGSKVLISFLPPDWQVRMHRLEPFGIFIVLFLLMFGLFSIILFPILFLFKLFIGF